MTGSIVGHKSVDGTVENESDGLVDGMAKDAKVNIYFELFIFKRYIVLTHYRYFTTA